MTREFLERYQGILADIAAIQADKVTDVVWTSSSEPPYGKHPLSIRGTEVKKSQRLEALYRDKAEIELYIESVEDDTIRAIMRYRIKQGMSWDQVAARMGYHYTVDTVKYRYRTHFQK